MLIQDTRASRLGRFHTHGGTRRSHSHRDRCSTARSVRLEKASRCERRGQIDCIVQIKVGCAFSSCAPLAHGSCGAGCSVYTSDICTDKFEAVTRSTSTLFGDDIAPLDLSVSIAFQCCADCGARGILAESSARDAVPRRSVVQRLDVGPQVALQVSHRFGYNWRGIREVGDVSQRHSIVSHPALRLRCRLGILPK